MFSYFIIAGKIHSLFAFVIFGTQIALSNIYLREKGPIGEDLRPIGEDLRPIGEDLTVESYSSEEEDSLLSEAESELLHREFSERKIPLQHEGCDVITKIYSSRHDPGHSSRHDPGHSSRHDPGHSSRHDPGHNVSLVNGLQKKISTSFLPHQASQDTATGEFSENLSLHSSLGTVRSFESLSDADRINDEIVQIKKDLKNLYETDKKDHQGFFPENPEADRLRKRWKGRILSLPAYCRRKYFIDLIECLDDYNYSVLGTLFIGTLRDQASFISIKGSSIDSELEGWIEKNKKYFKFKRELYMMESAKHLNNRLKKKIKSKNYSQLHKKKLLDTYLLMARRLKQAGLIKSGHLNEVFEEHKRGYSKIFLPEEYSINYPSFLAQYSFP